MGHYTTTDKGMYGEHKGTIGARERMKDARKDPYVERQKWHEPTKCPVCGSVFTAGRWTWEIAPPNAESVLCPACRRIEEDYPAGIVRLTGEFFVVHRKEILHLVRNIEAQEEQEHPLERIMTVRDTDDGVEITTTGTHLARRFGDALKRAYRGALSVQYVENEKRVRIDWSR